jgi:exosortase
MDHVEGSGTEDSRLRSTALVTAAALLWCYSATIAGMARQWWTDEDMGHGFAVPFVALWIIWHERRRWRGVPMRPSIWGCLILAAGAALHLAGALGVGLFVSAAGLLLSILGVIVCLGGFAILRAWSFPLLLCVFMLPKLAIVYNQATLPLQLLASRMAAGMLTLTGYGVVRAGNILDVGGHRILVAEACNGIRYLIPLCFIAAIAAYLLDSRGWTRIFLAVAAVPVAIVANAVRVALAGAWPMLAEGAPHAISGTVIFVCCLASLFLLLRLLPAPKAAPHA